MCCSKCNQDKPIVNKKHNLCDDCNFMRLHDGKTKAEVYSERAQGKEKKVYTIKQSSSPIRSKKPVKQQTEKEKSRKTQLSQIKNEIEEEAIFDNRYYCWGCGKSGVALDKSHILSVKQRKDLELDKENINLFCRECHETWESNLIHRMLGLDSFEKDLRYIMKMDKNRYNGLIHQLNDFCTIELYQFEVPEKIIIKAQQLASIYDYLE